MSLARIVTVLGLAVAINGQDCEPGMGCYPLIPTTDYSKGDLTGLHLIMTTVHNGAAMNMYDADGNLLPSSEWTGFQKDVIDYVAEKAGFTYELRSASGYGPNCPTNEDGSLLTPAEYAGNYGCAERDTYDDNVPNASRTHMYWAQYYITPGRIKKSLFTSPVISDVGISMVMKPPVTGMWQSSMDLIITPFTGLMWGLSFMTIAIVAFVMWFVDHGGTIDTRMQLAEELPELYGRYQSRLTSGYLTLSRFLREMPPYLVNGAHTLVGNPTGYETQAAASGILNICVSVFAMVWVTIWGAQLTSNLTVAKLAVGVAGLYELETAQLQLRTGPACSQAGAAYTRWLQTNYPLMDIVGGASIEVMTEMLSKGECDSMLIILPAAQQLAASCQGINLVGNPLKFGPQDFATGVRLDMPEVTQALSYWINELRLKSAEGNMADKFNQWHAGSTCAGGGAASDAIGYENFILAFLLCWGVAGLALFWELGQLRFRDRMIALCRGSGLWKCVTDDPFNCVNPKTGTISMNRLRRTFKAAFMEASSDGNLKTGGAAYNKVVTCLRRHMVGPDLGAWQLILATHKEMATELKVLNLSGGSIGSFAKLQRDLALAKHENNRDKAAAKIGLFWRNRAKFKNARVRMDALLKIQEDMLLAAINAIEKDAEKMRRDQQAKGMKAKAAPPAPPAAVAPTSKAS